MSDTAVAMTQLVANAESADVLTNAEGGTAVTANNVAVITCSGYTGNVFLTLYNASGGATITFAAGDEPPSERSGLGTDAVVIPAGDCVVYCVEAGRFMQDNGTIRGTVTTNTIVVGAFRLPLNS